MTNEEQVTRTVTVSGGSVVYDPPLDLDYYRRLSDWLTVRLDKALYELSITRERLHSLEKLATQLGDFAMSTRLS